MKETRDFTVHNTSVLYSLTLNYYIKLCGTIIITITIRIIGFACEYPTMTYKTSHFELNIS